MIKVVKTLCLFFSVFFLPTISIAAISCDALSGNGSIDESSTLSSCLNAAALHRSKTVELPAGVYRLQNFVTVPPHVSLVGRPGAEIKGTIRLSNYSKVMNIKFHTASRSVIIGDTGLVKGAEVRNCVFGNGKWTSVALHFAHDCIIDGNTFNSISKTTSMGGGRGLSIAAGKRNKITNNIINGGETCIIFLRSREWGDGAEAHFENNEIAYNTCNQFAEEGISHDSNSHPKDVASREYDTVAAINGKIVTLSHPNWAGKRNRYIGYDMIGMPDDENVYGNIGRIVAQADGKFTLDRSISGLKVGHSVVIGLTFQNNWIHHNTINFGSWGAILLEGLSFNNVIEDNKLIGDYVSNKGKPSISIRHLGNYAKAMDSVTGTYARNPCAYNIIRRNKAYAIYDQYMQKKYGPGQPYYFGGNNAIYNNELKHGVELFYVNSFVEKNSGILKKNQSTILGFDPTDSYDSGSNISFDSPLDIYPPKNVLVISID